MSRSRRLLTWIVLLVLMVAFGAGVNRYLASGSTVAFAPAEKPTQTAVKLSLPGTVRLCSPLPSVSVSGTYSRPVARSRTSVTRNRGTEPCEPCASQHHQRDGYVGERVEEA